MADQSYQYQYRQQVGQQHQQGHQDLQQRGQEAVHNFKNLLQQKAPSTPQLVALITVVPFGAFLLFLASLAFMGSLVGLAVATPLFILFSPVIVPATIAIGLAVVGFLSSGAFGITGLSAFSWIINFLRYRTAAGMGGVENIMQGAQDTAGHVGQKVKEMGQEVGAKAREAGRT